MPARRPLVVEEAVRRIESQAVFPTELKSWAIEELPQQWKDRSFFSAGVTHAEFLEEAKEQVRLMASGQLDRASARLKLKETLAKMDYKPRDPSDEGTIKDLRTDRRLNLILDTNTDMVRSYGQWQAMQSPGALKAYPAMELVRVFSARVPRPWRKKWAAAGGKFYGGRMIALKQDPIWSKSLAEGGFNRFGIPTGPYDYNSGMRGREVPLKEVRALGLVPPPLPAGEKGSMNDGLQAKPKRVPSGKLAAALQASGLAKVDEDGRVTFTPGRAVPPPLPTRPGRRVPFESLDALVDYAENRLRGIEGRLEKAVELGTLGPEFGDWAGKRFKLTGDDAFHILRKHRFSQDGAGAGAIDRGDIARIARDFNKVTSITKDYKGKPRRREAVYSIGRAHDLLVGLYLENDVVFLRSLYARRKKKLNPR